MLFSRKTTILTLVSLFFCFFAFWPQTIQAADDLAARLQGKLLLQAEDKGQIWYVDQDKKRRHITVDTAYDTFEELSLGITDADLDKSSTAAEFLDEQKDSDNDGYPDKIEAQRGYNLFGAGKTIIDNNLAKRLNGRFLLQVNDRGRIWYVNPDNLKKYEVKRINVMNIFRALALGITNRDLNDIAPHEIAHTPQPSAPTPGTPPLSYTPPTTYTPPATDDTGVLKAAAGAIISGSISQAKSHFTPEMQMVIEYTMNFLNSEGRYNLGNIMSGARLTSSTDAEKIYSTTISYAGYTKTISFLIKKQPDGSWLLANL